MVTAGEPDTSAGVAADASGRRRRPAGGRPRLVVHLLAYGLLLVGLLVVTNLDSSWTLDDGAYATQVKVVEQTGGWDYPYQHRDRDPDTAFAPVSHSTETEDGGSYPYVKLPAWIFVLRASTAVFGSVVGLYVPSALGAMAAAAGAWVLARRLDPDAAPFAFWAVGAGPLLVHSTAMWAHTWGAALGAVVAVVVVDVARRQHRWWHPLALVLAGGALAAIRNEGMLLVLAGALVLGVLSLRDRPTWTGLARSGASIGGLVAAGLVARLGSARWERHLAPGGRSPFRDGILRDLGFVDAQWRGFVRTFVDGAGQVPAGTRLAVVVTVCFVGGALLVRRGGSSVALGAVVVVVALVVSVVRTGNTATFDLAGLLVAVPLITIGAVVFRWRTAPVEQRALLGLVGLLWVAVILTNYPEGGSRDWGGRFLFVALVPATVVAVIVVRRALHAAPQVLSPRHATAVLAALVVVPALLGVHATQEVRQAMDRTTEQAVEPGVPTTIWLERYLTRGSWRELPERDWLSAQPGAGADALAMLRPDRDDPVLVFGPGAEDVRAPGYHRDVLSPTRVVFVPR